MSALIGGSISLAVIAAVVLTVLVYQDQHAEIPAQVRPSTTGRGDPALANRLAEQARQLAHRDPLARLRLLIAAHTVDPDSAAHRDALSRVLLGPSPLATLGTAVAPIHALSFAHDGQHLAIGGHGAQQATIADPTTPALASPLTGPMADISALTYANDGQLRMAGDTGAATVSTTADSTAQPLAPNLPALHDVASLNDQHWAATTRDGRLILVTAPLSITVLATGLGPRAPLTATPDGDRLFTSTPTGLIQFDLTDPASPQRTTITSTEPAHDLAVSADGTHLLAAQDNQATLWDISTAPRQVTTLNPQAGPVISVALAPDATRAITATATSATLWDLHQPDQPATTAVLAAAQTISTVAFNDDASLIATAEADTVTLWSTTELDFYQSGQVEPAITAQADIGDDQPISYATTSSDSSYLLTSDTVHTTFWRTHSLTGARIIAPVRTVDTPINNASAAGDRIHTTVVTINPHGVSTYDAVGPSRVWDNRALDIHADTIAVAADGQEFITVEATTATLWHFAAAFGPQAVATLSYPTPTTTLAFAPRGTNLIAGHADGSITIHHIGYPTRSTDKQTLTSDNGPVDAVALSTDTATALAVHRNGTVAVWRPSAITTGPTASVDHAAGTGSHRAWLSPNGAFAIISSTTAPTTLWSLADPTSPTPIRTLFSTAPTAAVPAMFGNDARTGLTISRDNAVTMWNLDPLQKIIDDPVQRACELASLDHNGWQQMVTNPAFLNPCQPPPLPKLDGD